MTVVLPQHRGAVAPHRAQPRSEVRVYELVLVAIPSAVTCARLLVRYVARRWRLDRSCEKQLGVAAEALVRHGVVTAGCQDEPARSYGVPETPCLIVFRLYLTPRDVVAEVWDSGTEVPEPFPAIDAEDCGCDLPRRGMRVMWCAVRLGIAAHDIEVRTAAGIPRRQRLPGPTRASVAMRDPTLLQRILNGLQKLNAGGE
jgi:hypothetical protein